MVDFRGHKTHWNLAPYAWRLFNRVIEGTDERNSLHASEGVIFITGGVRSDKPDDTLFDRHASGALVCHDSHMHDSPMAVGLSVYRCVAAGVKPKTTARERCDGAIGRGSTSIR